MNVSTASPSATPPTLATAAPRPVKAGVMPLFPTWIYLCQEGPRHLNPRLEGLTYRLMQDEGNGTRRTNDGGWHYAFDVFQAGDRNSIAFNATNP